MSRVDELKEPRSGVTRRQNTSSQWGMPSPRRWLILILVVAVGLRIASACHQGNTVTVLPGIYDQLSYDGLAQRVVAGHGFSFGEPHWPATPAGQPTAHWSYLYTLYLAAIYYMFGPQPLIARLVQSIAVGILHTWLAWRIGRRLFGVYSGLIAAGLSAVYIYFFYYSGSLMSEAFYFVGILWSFDVAFRIVDPRWRKKGPVTFETFRWSDWTELGLAIGITVLLRQVFLLFVPSLYLWLWRNAHSRLARGSKQGILQRFLRSPFLRGSVLSSLCVVMLVLPWTLRNYRSFGRLVLLNTNSGFAFYWGNHPIHGKSFIPVLPAGGPSYLDLIPENLRSLNEAVLDRALLNEGLQTVIANPARYLLLCLSRTIEYFKFWPSHESSMISNVSRVASFGIVLPFVLHGLYTCLFLLRQPEHCGQRAQIALLLLFMATYTLIHLLTWTLIRYRLPVDVIMVIFAAKSLEISTCRIWGIQRTTELSGERRKVSRPAIENMV